MPTTPRTKSRPARLNPTLPPPLVAINAPASTPLPDESASEQEDVWGDIERQALSNPDIAELLGTVKELSSGSALSDGTIGTYTKRFQQFHRWCADIGLSSKPASTATVLLYIASRQKAGRAPRTIRIEICAVAYFHERDGLANPCDHPKIREAMKGVARLSAESGYVQKRAHPLSIDEVRAMVACLPSLKLSVGKAKDLQRLRLKTILLVAFFSGRRMDEMIRADVSWLVERNGILYFESDHQKDRPSGFSTIIERLNDMTICPRTALESWLEATKAYRNETTRLFACPKADKGELTLVDRIARDYQEALSAGPLPSQVGVITHDDFVKSSMLTALNLENRRNGRTIERWMEVSGVVPVSDDRRLTGHSMRRGLITELRGAHVDARVVATHVGLSNLNMVEHYNDSPLETDVLGALGL